MRVLFDYQAYIQQLGGISRYATNLICNFSDNIDVKLPTIWSDNIYLKNEGIVSHSFLEKNRSTYKYKAYKALNMAQSIAELHMRKYDIFHPTFLNPYFIKHVSSPVVVTIHDLNFDKFPQYFKNSETVMKRVSKICQFADAIIAISNQTKMDLMRFHNIPEEKIHVIYHGIEQEIVDFSNNSYYKNPYLLYIGGRNGYKNFQNFLSAFSMINDSVDLVCTGLPFCNEELVLINKLGLSDRVHQLYATDFELSNLLCNAIAFIYPSLGEGFGLPILEAYRCKCPCIISDIMCFHEVAGEAAQYFNPASIDDMTTVISKTILDTKLLTDLKIAGLDRLKLFVWKDTAGKTEKIYKSIC